MKFVIVKAERNGYEFPFIFSAELTHANVALWAQRSVEREFHCPTEVVSAGFISHHTGEANGMSESLDLKCRPLLDQKVIDRECPRAAPSQWSTNPPIVGAWYWVTDGERRWPALHDKNAAGGWTNQDTWEDFTKEVERWCVISAPPSV